MIDAYVAMIETLSAFIFGIHAVPDWLTVPIVFSGMAIGAFFSGVILHFFPQVIKYPMWIMFFIAIGTFISIQPTLLVFAHKKNFMSCKQDKAVIVYNGYETSTNVMVCKHRETLNEPWGSYVLFDKKSKEKD